MKISQLILELETTRRDVGDLEVKISSDEEGNCIYKEFMIDTFGEDSICIYPFGDVQN